jgi:thiamine biosynthesis lipoprotein
VWYNHIRQLLPDCLHERGAYETWIETAAVSDSVHRICGGAFGAFLPMIRKTFRILAVMIACACLFGACSAATPQTSESFCMNTFVTQTVYSADDSILVENNQILTEIENTMSRTITSSDISLLNAASGQPVSISQETADVLQRSLEAAQETHGAFNPALGAVISAWGFGTQNAHVPEQTVIADSLRSTDYSAITVEAQATPPSANAGGTQIDLGGCVKGYALDRLAENLAKHEVSSAILSVGGSLYAVGEKPNGEPYRIGIRDPQGSENDYMATMQLNGKFVSTSGTYERGFTEDGVYYHHLIDPQTGYPVQNGLVSVTVVCDNGFLSDVYSTALFVMGAEEGIRFAQDHGADALFLTEDSRIITTEGFVERYGLQITNNQYAFA